MIKENIGGKTTVWILQATNQEIITKRKPEKERLDLFKLQQNIMQLRPIISSQKIIVQNRIASFVEIEMRVLIT